MNISCGSTPRLRLICTLLAPAVSAASIADRSRRHIPRCARLLFERLTSVAGTMSPARRW
jgi:hypothetical protein